VSRADPLATRVRRALREAGVGPGDTVLAAVSGGVDSMVLLHLLAAQRARTGVAVAAAHLHHGLRGADADADAALVAATCERLDVPLISERRPVTVPAGASPQAAYRRVRHAFLAEAARAAGARWIATGHHADDLAETVLMRLLAGAGPGGLAAMARPGPPETGLTIIRPLLGTRKAALVAWARRHGVAWREDASNADPRYDRNRLRAEVMPALAAVNPNLVGTLCREARVLADEADYLDRAAADALAPLRRAEGDAMVLDRAGLAALHPAVARHALARLLAEHLSARPSADHVEAVLDLARGRTGRRADLPGGAVAEARYGDLVLAWHAPAPAPPARPMPVRVPGVTPVPWAGLALEARYRAPDAAPGWAYFDLGRFSGPLAVRPREPGDRFRPAGLGGHSRTLKRFLADRKVPRGARGATPLLVAPEGILWVVGVRQDERFVVKDGGGTPPEGSRPLAVRVLPTAGPEADGGGGNRQG
jgi:tRNA(Ile)-lysidine synthase